jgi:PRTRC genetic system protein E
MLKQLNNLLRNGEVVTIVIQRNSEEGIILSFSSRSQTMRIPPLIFTGSPDGITEGIIPALTRTSESLKGLKTNEDELDEVIKQEINNVKTKLADKQAKAKGATPSKAVEANEAEVVVPEVKAPVKDLDQVSMFL